MSHVDFEKKELGLILSEREVASIASSSSLGFKPIRKRGVPRTVPPNFFKSPAGWFRHELWSWRFYVWMYAALAGVVILIHVFALIAITSIHPFDSQGRSTLYEGSCSRVDKTNRYVHWFFSVFGTGYLSASAYVMYCLTGPTRDEIDRAHEKGRWLDIGVMSLRNVLAVSRKRIFYFLLLGFSSPFIQLFYNAIVFITHSTNSYSVFVANESFLNPGTPTIKLSQDQTEAKLLESHFGPLAIHMHDLALNNTLDKLSVEDCITDYAVALQSARRNVVLITTETKRTADVFDVYHAFIPTENPAASGEQFSWICNDQGAVGDQCLYHVPDIKGNPRNWTVAGSAQVQYCLSEKTPEHCKLQVSLSMSIVALVTIIFKVVVMFAVAIHVKESPLMTTGDAIESFMKDPDVLTQGMCMASKRMIEANPTRWPQIPIFLQLQKHRWCHTIKTRIAFFCLLFTLSLCLNAALFCTVKDAISIPHLWSLGFGQINRNFFIGWHHKTPKYFVRAIFLSNVGHGIFGILYIIYNNVFYAMTFANEWSRYAGHRKGLRVSEAPRGAQRTVYFFLMPYKLAFPIMLFSCGIHTLISNTLFLVDVETYGHDPGLGEGVGTYTRTPQFDFTTTGFSPLANASLMVAGAAMIFYLLGCASSELKSTMPVTGTCSAAISAACHPEEDEPDDFYLKKIKWGETGVKDGVGHCTFSSKEVEPVNEHTPYA